MYEEVSLDTISCLSYRPSSVYNWRQTKWQVCRLLQHGVLWFKIRQDEMDWWNARMYNRQWKVRKKIVHTGRVAHPLSSSMGTGSLSRGHSGRGVALTTHPTSSGPSCPCQVNFYGTRLFPRYYWRYNAGTYHKRFTCYYTNSLQRRENGYWPYITYGLFQTKGETCATLGSDWFRNVDLYKAQTNKSEQKTISALYI